MSTAVITPAKFTAGFEAGIRLWKTGYTFEQIVVIAEEYRSPSYVYYRGMKAAQEALAGKMDEAERMARAAGHTRESAAELVNQARRA